MLKWTTITQTFFDGFSPLDALLERAVRPGSTENLIDVNHPSPLVLHFAQDISESREAMNRMMAELNVAVMRLAADELRQALKETGAPRKVVERHGNA